MSFKREGVDKSLLNVLRKRRVEELFAENIPNDEAQMLSNGKFTCTVCNYRPVFDTVQILAQHRNGKKHLENVKRAKVKLDEIQELIEIRKQNQSLGNSSSTLPGISKAATPLLTKSPYDARVMKNRLKSHDRKPTINLQNSSTNVEPYLGGAKIPFSILKNSSEEKTESLKPYSRRTRMKDGHTSLLSVEETNDCLSSEAKVGESNLNKVDQIKKKIEWDNFTVSLAKKKCSKSKSVLDSSGDDKSSLTHLPKDSRAKIKDDQTKELAYKYWQLAGSGWKKNWTGEWEKDEQAEFDSDEEPPDLP